jgi:hypothetical protein
VVDSIKVLEGCLHQSSDLILPDFMLSIIKTNRSVVQKRV